MGWSYLPAGERRPAQGGCSLSVKESAVNTQGQQSGHRRERDQTLLCATGTDFTGLGVTYTQQFKELIEPDFMV